jgi:bifunctional non-homologous end joining protein LigD
LLVGYYDTKGLLRHAGHVGTGKGFNREFLQTLYAQIIEFEEPSSPFARFAPSVVRSPWGQGNALAVRWVKPIVVVDVGYLELSSRGQLRHAAFRGFRTDVQAHDVIRNDSW